MYIPRVKLITWSYVIVSNANQKQHLFIFLNWEARLQVSLCQKLRSFRLY